MNPTNDYDDNSLEPAARVALGRAAGGEMESTPGNAPPPPARGWPAAGACLRIALVIFGLALAMHLSISVLALSLGFGIRSTVIISELVSLLGLSLWVSFRMGVPAAESLALRPAATVHAVVAIVAAVPLQVFGGAMQYLVLQLWPDDGTMKELLERSMQELLRTDTVFDVFTLFLTGVVLAAVCEEVLFRGLLLQLLARHSGWAAAIVLGAILFSAFHLDPIGFLPRLPIGLFLGMLVWRSGSLYPAVLAHGTFNFVGLFVVAPSEEPITFAGIMTAGLLAGLVFCAILAIYWRITEATPPPLGKPVPDMGGAWQGVTDPRT